jgi:NAD(P)-dependent dehydrogenase (short-subunit alcohol dehydrogenase family)
MKKLENTCALVTGAASGIGKAIALLFAQEGAKVVVADQDAVAAEAVAHQIRHQGGHALGLACDVSDQQQVERLLEATLHEFGSLDVLVNNAGIMDNFMPLDKVTDVLWEKIMAVNVKGPFFTCRLAIVQMLKQGKGSIINIASVGGVAGARAGLAYTTSKHALVGMSKNIGFMYAQKGIRCNAIAPGGVTTHIMDDAEPDQEGAALCSSGAGSMPRMGEANEIAKVALFLASDDASFVNGETLVADGGWLAY